MRQILSFPCEGKICVATLDAASGSAGLLIVSGGNEIRVGSHRGLAKLAADVAAAGFPVFRYDRRGIGESTGANGGFEGGGDDLCAAVSAFRNAQPQLTRIIGFGNCDGATTLLLNPKAGIDALVLGNPWLEEGETASPAKLRAYYLKRLFNPAAWRKLLGGSVNFVATTRDLSSAAKPEASTTLAERVSALMQQHPRPTHIILAEEDGTAISFQAQWALPMFDAVRGDVKVQHIACRSHSFASHEDYELLRKAVLKALA